MTAQDGNDRSDVSLVTVPPSRRQEKTAFGIIAILLLAFAATAPFAGRQLAPIHSYIPTMHAIVFVTDLITAVLLFGHYSIAASRAILVLAAGYFFSALTVVPYALSFPGAFSPSGVFGDTQTPVWIYFFWHTGFPLTVIAYALLKPGRQTQDRAGMATLAGAPSAIVSSIVLSALAVGAFTLAAAHAERFLPRLLQDELSGTALLPYGAIACSLASVVALGILWRRRSSILDLWLTVALCAGVTEPLLIAVFASTRFSVGWYASRVYTVVTSTAVLAALLSEATILYGILSRNIRLLQHERRTRLMNVEAVVASITHEVRQPLSAITANGSAALLFLDRPEPEIGEAREALNAILQDCFNASQMFDSIRALFRSGEQPHHPVDVNEVVRAALHMVRGLVKDQQVTAYTELASDLPLVPGHRVQLQEVVLNLLHNAIDAMATVSHRPRILRVRTEQDSEGAIALSVQDTGPGIDPHKLDVIFDPFITTKTHGMGLGLCLCRMIVERHGGRISASTEADRGARFDVNLPIAAAAGGATG